MTEQHYQMMLNDAIALYNNKFGVIYRIYCEETNFSYVGQTKDVYNNGNTGNVKGLSRIKTHYNALKKGCHPCLKLQTVWDNTKGKSIRYEILEIIPREDESDWIFRKKLLSAEKPWQEVYKHHEELAPARHYALKAQELKELKGAGILNNATFVYFALKLKNPWCDRPIRIRPAEFAVEWDIPESSVYEAIAKLKSSELISINQAEIIIQWKIDSQQASHSDNPECVTESQNELRDFRIDSDNPECVTESQNELRDFRIDSEISENRQLEPLPDKGSEITHTIHTVQTLKNTTEQKPNCCVLEKFKEKLHFYSVYLETYDQESQGLVPNPKIATIRGIIKEMPEEKAERAIAAFLAWLPTAKNVRCKYAAFASSLRENWES